MPSDFNQLFRIPIMVTEADERDMDVLFRNKPALQP